MLAWINKFKTLLCGLLTAGVFGLVIGGCGGGSKGSGIVDVDGSLRVVVEGTETAAPAGVRVRLDSGEETLTNDEGKYSLSTESNQDAFTLTFSLDALINDAEFQFGGQIPDNALLRVDLVYDVVDDFFTATRLEGENLDPDDPTEVILAPITPQQEPQSGSNGSTSSSSSSSSSASSSSSSSGSSSSSSSSTSSTSSSSSSTSSSSSSSSTSSSSSSSSGEPALPLTEVPLGCNAVCDSFASLQATYPNGAAIGFSDILEVGDELFWYVQVLQTEFPHGPNCCDNIRGEALLTLPNGNVVDLGSIAQHNVTSPAVLNHPYTISEADVQTDSEGVSFVAAAISFSAGISLTSPPSELTSGNGASYLVKVNHSGP